MCGILNTCTQIVKYPMEAYTPIISEIPTSGSTFLTRWLYPASQNQFRIFCWLIQTWKVPSKKSGSTLQRIWQVSLVIPVHSKGKIRLYYLSIASIHKFSWLHAFFFYHIVNTFFLMLLQNQRSIDTKSYFPGCNE